MFPSSASLLTSVHERISGLDARGKSLAVRRPVGGGGRRLQFLALLEARHRRHAAVLHRARPGQAGVRIPLSASGAQDRERLALPHPGDGTSRRRALRVPGRRPARAGARTPLRSAEKSCSIRTRRRCSSPRIQPRRVRANAGPTDGRAPLGRLPKKGSRRRSAPDRARVTPAGTRSSMNCTSKDSPRARTPGVTPDEARHVCRTDGEDSVPQGTRRHDRRAAAGPPVRSAGGQLLGLHDAALLLAAPVIRARARPSRNSARWCEAFHAAGIEVWLDVVYNHTAEGDETGPTYSYRGMDNSSYYLLTPGSAALRQRYRLRQHRAHRPSRRARAGARKPAFLGAHHGRGWLSLRSGVDLFARGRRHDERSRSVPGVGDQPARAPVRRPAGGRGVGHRQLSARPRVSRHRRGCSGTASFATTCGRSCAASRARWAR